ncbi:MAG: M48 family metallopeptidase [Burkholderiales bacterium]|jgi:STE24 endopeptidase|nr:M48 family metallopeptidase [Burkholderiales bacterium]
MHPFAAVFLAALACATAIRLWLAWRHMRHVRSQRAAVPAAFAESITLDAHQKAADYTVAKTRLGIVDILIGATLLLALTFGGGLQALAAFWGGVFAPDGYAYGIALVASVAVIGALVELPVSLYRIFVVEARFGFNRMTLPLFLADLAKQTLVGAALGLPLLFVVLWLMQRMGSLWWLYVWLTWAGFNLLVLALYPTLIAPLFNKFSPLDDASLRERVDALLARTGFRAKGLFVMDGSKRSSHGNAYFTGFGAAKRIVFFDTLLARLAPAEIEAVLAHELGHFRRRHVWKRVAWLFAGSLAFLAVLGGLIDKPWFYAALGVRAPGTAMALVLFFLVAPVFTFLLQPVASVYSRKHEYEADAYAAEYASAADLVRALVKLYKDNAATLTPDPLHSAFYDSHPPAGMRIARLESLTARG